MSASHCIVRSWDQPRSLMNSMYSAGEKTATKMSVAVWMSRPGFSGPFVAASSTTDL